uniref:Uncharacterized protein n=1 Tax=Aureoumbra lagunensis TaxID=44058 RepID=A0A7S3NQ22_9STRA
MGNAVSRGRWGVVNSLVGSILTSLGLRCQEWARAQVAREERGLEPMSSRTYTETRLALVFGLLCVAGGGLSAILNDALLPQSTQAPLGAWVIAARVLMTKNNNILYSSDASLLSNEEHAELWRRRSALALTIIGPLVALCGARLDDFSGLSVSELRDTATSVPALATAVLSLTAILLAPRSATRCLQEADSHSHREAVDLARRAVIAAFITAWAHVACKAFVELMVEAKQKKISSTTCHTSNNSYNTENCGWNISALLCFSIATILLLVKLRLVASALSKIPPYIFMPLYRGLAIAANAICGIIFWDDLRIASALDEESIHSSPVIDVDPHLVPPTINAVEVETTGADVIAYLVGLILSVAGVLLVGWTMTDMHSEIGIVFGRDSNYSSSGRDGSIFNYHPVKAFLISTHDEEDDDLENSSEQKEDTQIEAANLCDSSLAEKESDALKLPPSTGGLADWQHAANISAETNTVFTASLPTDSITQHQSSSSLS